MLLISNLLQSLFDEVVLGRCSLIGPWVRSLVDQDHSSVLSIAADDRKAEIPIAGTEMEQVATVLPAVGIAVADEESKTAAARRTGLAQVLRKILPDE